MEYQRILQIKKKDLLLYQTEAQIGALDRAKGNKIRDSLHEWKQQGPWIEIEGECNSNKKK